jgi:hypothetical protein
MDHPRRTGMNMPKLPKNANQIPLFPQDAFMGPMIMDKEVDEAETYGLPAGWSRFVGGMMTLVRVCLRPVRQNHGTQGQASCAETTSAIAGEGHQHGQ